jgi:sulfur carrier protein
MAKITLNGAEHELSSSTNVAALLQAQGYAERRVAIEINNEIVPQSLHAQRWIHDGDKIEIVQAIGGG